MLSASDWLHMQAEAAKIITDRSFDIQFRRGDETLEPQEVRIEAVNRGYRMQTDAARESRVAMVVMGAIDLNVAIDDRFTAEGILYKVVSIAPDRDILTQAEAVAVE